MENIFDFMSASLPWVAMGLLLAIFFVRAAHMKKKDEKKEDHASEGMALGMCFGVALSTALHVNTGLGCQHQCCLRQLTLMKSILGVPYRADGEDGPSPLPSPKWEGAYSLD